MVAFRFPIVQWRKGQINLWRVLWLTCVGWDSEKACMRGHSGRQRRHQSVVSSDILLVGLVLNSGLGYTSLKYILRKDRRDLIFCVIAEDSSRFDCGS